MTEPRDHYVGEGGDGSDERLPDTVPDPAPRAEEPEPAEEADLTDDLAEEE